MGVMYYLAREDNRTLFEIGKLSAISDLFREFGEGRAREWEWLPREVPPESDLRELIRAAIDDLDFSVDRDTYAAELARRIVAFANGQSVCLLNDASSDDKMHNHYTDDNDRLRVVDSVYTAEWGDGSIPVLPKRCPSCRSSDPAERFGHRLAILIEGVPPPTAWCQDAWHDRARGPGHDHTGVV